MKIVTRFPPSPTGSFHIGSARTALFNYLFARHHGGAMYLRFEDTDRERSKPEFEQDIIEGLRWLGIDYMLPSVYRQSENIAVYERYLNALVESGAAYEAEPASDNPDTKVIRFKNPNTSITFEDLVRGNVTFDTADLGDFVIAKGRHQPLYHLAVVIDDQEMSVSHVIRGEDHISNTPRQILISEALGFSRPAYAHIPLILAPDRSKLSKRHGAVSINEYREQGFLPEAIVNYLALLGWNPGTDRELYALDELAQAFSLENVQRSGAIFDVEKLRWFNHAYVQKLTDEKFTATASSILQEALRARGVAWSGPIADSILQLARERINTWDDLRKTSAEGEYDFFFKDPTLDVSTIPQKGSSREDALRYLTELKELFTKAAARDYEAPERIKAIVWDYAASEGRGKVLWPLRYAMTGRERSPDPFVVAHVIGKESIIGRIESAIKQLSI